MFKSGLIRLQFVLLLLLGIILIWYALGKISFSDLNEKLKTGDYRVIFPVTLASLAGYLFRSLRMRMMLVSMGESCRRRSLYASLCMGYLVSFAIPRLGDLSRALTVKKTDQVKVDFALIAIVAERMADVVSLLVLTVVALILNRQFLFDFFGTVFNGPLLHDHPSYWFLGLLLVLIPAMYFALRKKQDWLMMAWKRYQPALRGLFKGTGLFWFWIYTALIWCCYFLMTWLWFFLFDATSHLTMGNAFLVMIVGSVGRSVPVQGGGMGVYHVLVGTTLTYFGLSVAFGNALALIIHGAQAVITLISGITSYIWMLSDLKSGVKSEALRNN